MLSSNEKLTHAFFLSSKAHYTPASLSLVHVKNTDVDSSVTLLCPGKFA